MGHGWHFLDAPRGRGERLFVGVVRSWDRESHCIVCRSSGLTKEIERKAASPDAELKTKQWSGWLSSVSTPLHLHDVSWCAQRPLHQSTALTHLDPVLRLR